MKPKASDGPTVEQQHYWAWLRAFIGRCEACGTRAQLNIHHLLARAPGKVGRRDHWFVVLICAGCHTGAKGVHGLGSEAKFLTEHRVDLVAISVQRRGEWDRANSA